MVSHRQRELGSVEVTVPSVVAVTVAVSVPSLTVRALLIAGLAITALVLAGWRKPARAEPRSHRVSEFGAPPSPRSVRRSRGVPVEHHPTPMHGRPGPLRRLLALGVSSGIAVLVGVLTAIVVAFGAAFAVIWMTNLLEQ